MSTKFRELPAVQLGGLTFRELAWRTWREIDELALMTRAAAIAFYGIAALVPFMGLLIVLSAQAVPFLDRAFSGSLDFEPAESLDALLTHRRWLSPEA